MTDMIFYGPKDCPGLTHTFNSEAEYFLSVCNDFSLGHLLTEQRHPLSMNLSNLAKNDLSAGVEVLREIDIHALKQFRSNIPALVELSVALHSTLKEGNKIFIFGCGATGRLSLTAESLWRLSQGNSSPFKDSVIAFMSGGDRALISSVEGFEDRPDFGKRQLFELGFSENDLFIGITEGGETPIVIGATEAASRASRRKPFFLYCNPDSCLMSIERSKQVLESNNINKINLTCGPMALSGSTRMQASTVQLAAIGMALLISPDEHSAFVDRLLEKYSKQNLEALCGLIEEESAHYKQGGVLHYVSDPGLAISVLTDTTERAPTFSLAPFDRKGRLNDALSLVYLKIPGVQTPEEAWKHVLGRGDLRCLEWEDISSDMNRTELLNFDISEAGLKLRENERGYINPLCFHIIKNSQTDELLIHSTKNRLNMDVNNLGPIGEHLLLKMTLNALSTLVMGRLNRYESNVMTYVKASNFKLVDRAARYSLMLLNDQKVDVPYDKVVSQIFEIKDRLATDQAIVMHVVEHFLNKVRS